MHFFGLNASLGKDSADVSDHNDMEELRCMVFGNTKLGHDASDCPTLMSLQLIQDMGVIVRRPNAGDLIVSEGKALHYYRGLLITRRYR